MEEEFSFWEEPGAAYDKAPVYDIKHRAYGFSKEVLLFIGSLKFDRIYFSIFDQLIRSGTSIGANVVESRAGSSVSDFLKFYTIGPPMKPSIGFA